MYPDDRVLVGVVKTLRDLAFAREQGWYRVPQTHMPRGVHTEYVALFLSGRVFKAQASTITCYAAHTGLELVRRQDLLPTQASHPRANEVYYKLQLGPLQDKLPPITNPTKRVFAFIHTTWDRFVHARHIADLYTEGDAFVDRVYHALRQDNIHIERAWEADARTYSYAPGVRVLCQQGAFTASVRPGVADVQLDPGLGPAELLARVRAALAERDGPLLLGAAIEEE